MQGHRRLPRLRRIAPAVLALLAAPSLASAQTPAAAGNPALYPAEKVLAAFATACSGVENPAVLRASALAAGWKEISPDPASQVGRLIAAGMGEIAKDPETKILPGLVLTRIVEGRELFLVASGVEIEALRAYGCRIYDFSAPAAISPEELERWAVRKPNDSQSQQGAVRHVWNPGLKPGHMEMEVSFVPQDAPIRREPLFASLSGLIFTATAMEPIEK